MPYEIRKVDGGEKLFNSETGKALSTRPLPHLVALRQYQILSAAEADRNPAGTSDRSEDGGDA